MKFISKKGLHFSFHFSISYFDILILSCIHRCSSQEQTELSAADVKGEAERVAYVLLNTLSSLSLQTNLWPVLPHLFHLFILNLHPSVGGDSFLRNREISERKAAESQTYTGECSGDVIPSENLWLGMINTVHVNTA